MGVLGIATSGMTASVRSYTVIANNIANSSTPGFKASRMEFREASVSHSGRQANGTPNQYGNGVVGVVASAGGPDTPDGSSNVDLTTELANLLQTGQGFKANAAGAKGADFMLATLLSM